MAEVFLYFEDKDAADLVSQMGVWSRLGLEVRAFSDVSGFLRLAGEGRAALCLIELGSRGCAGMELLGRIREENLIPHAAVYMKEADFGSLSRAVNLGICGCFTPDDGEETYLAVLSRITADRGRAVSGAVYLAELTEMLESHDGGIQKYVSRMKESVYSSMDESTADGLMRQVYASLVGRFFETYPWLGLYFSLDELLGKAESGEGADFFVGLILRFYDDFTSLSLQMSDSRLNEAVEYILNNPESDLRLKAISEKLYMNSTYLSTVFTAQAETRYVDYIIMVKLKRAAFLLKTVSLKVTDIAERLGYRDMGYFSKIFKKQYGMTPTEYRTPDNYMYEI